MKRQLEIQGFPKVNGRQYVLLEGGWQFECNEVAIDLIGRKIYFDSFLINKKLRECLVEA